MFFRELLLVTRGWVGWAKRVLFFVFYSGAKNFAESEPFDFARDKLNAEAATTTVS